MILFKFFFRCSKWLWKRNNATANKETSY